MINVLLQSSAPKTCLLTKADQNLHMPDPLHVPVERRLVRRIVEDLQKLRSSQMEHELRIDGEVAGEAEGDRVVFAIFCELPA